MTVLAAALVTACYSKTYRLYPGGKVVEITEENKGREPGPSTQQTTHKAVCGGERDYNGPYSGEYLNRVAFPLGGLGAGMVCLEGTGAISHVSVRNEMDVFNEPCTFAALCIVKDAENTARVIEGPVPGWKVFGAPNTGNGAAHTSYGLPRFERASFLARFPFGTVTLSDPDIPVDVTITGWSPFIPGHADDSSLPVAVLEYSFENPASETVDAVFSYSSKNFMATGGGGQTVLPMVNGFVLVQEGSEEKPENEGGFAVFTEHESTVVDHCWFKGGWWDALTLAWRNIQDGRLVDNPPMKGAAPGASLFVPMKIKPGERETVRLMLAWYVPKTKLRIGRDAVASGPAFGHGPSKGAASGQQEVYGFQGKRLVNTYDPAGDGQTGKLTSPEFRISGEHISFLIGGGSYPETACINLLVDGKAVRTATGKNAETLERKAWDVAGLVGKNAKIEIVDQEKGSWGHINVDQIVMSAPPGTDMEDTVLMDFESELFGDWIAIGPPAPEGQKCACTSTYHEPWYAGRFSSIGEVADYWEKNRERLRSASAMFRDAFYDSTLPAEVIEAAAANLTILKSPTVLRQTDGRMWCFEGCCDSRGCCHGSCTHVWNYAQAVPHLFPELERSLRSTEFNESQNEEGHQTFRSALPIRPVAHTYHAASDGQLGGIMKVYREWRISGDTGWLEEIWPKVKQSLNYCIRTWDPRGVGVLEEPHHNTYDIEYWGPDGHCSSFYLGALAAAAEMGTALGEDDDAARFRGLLEKGGSFLEDELFNGEYFFQKIRTEGLDAEFHPIDASANGPGYERIIEALNTQGPKYQYGTGCLSDGVLGFWIARMCGLDQALVDPEMVRSSLDAIYRHNLKHDLSGHANPQRPAYALGKEGGLLLCTWPRGGALSIPFVYSDEVWTGIEYQVASHLMLEGMVEEGLDIVRVCRDRYDGRVRNPFNEYECGHWYARAMSSYGLLQGLTGVRYDAVEKCLYIDSKVGDDFKSFLSTETGFGSVGLKNGQAFIDVKMGEIEVDRIVVR